MRQTTVIGAAGFIGGHLVRHLRQQGFDVHEASRDALSWPDAPLGHVFYCAGLTADFAQRPHDTVDAHVALLNRVLQQRRFESLVYLSSTRLYDGSLADPVGEDTPLTLRPGEPRHLFDLSKALGEALCHAAGGARARVARLSCVVHGAGDADGFLPQLLRDVAQAVARAEEGRPPQLSVDTTPFAARDYVHLDDVLRALLLIAVRGTQPVYNVAGGRNLSNRELFARLRELSGCDVVARRHDIVRPAPRIDISRLRNEFGWRPACMLDKLSELLPRQPALLPC